MSFDELVKWGVQQIIEGLCKGEGLHSIVFRIVELSRRIELKDTTK